MDEAGLSKVLMGVFLFCPYKTWRGSLNKFRISSDECRIFTQRERSGLDFFELVEKRDLGWIDFYAGLGNRPKGGLVYFGDVLKFPRLGRPFELEGVAFDRRGITVAGEGPGLHNLSGFLLDAAQRDERAGRNQAGFLGKFALGGEQRVFA